MAREATHDIDRLLRNDYPIPNPPHTRQSRRSPTSSMFALSSSAARRIALVTLTCIRRFQPMSVLLTWRLRLVPSLRRRCGTHDEEPSA